MGEGSEGAVAEVGPRAGGSGAGARRGMGGGGGRERTGGGGFGCAASARLTEIGDTSKCCQCWYVGQASDTTYRCQSQCLADNVCTDHRTAVQAHRPLLTSAQVPVVPPLSLPRGPVFQLQL